MTIKNRIYHILINKRKQISIRNWGANLMIMSAVTANCLPFGSGCTPPKIIYTIIFQM